MNKTSEQNRHHYFENVTSFLSKQMSCKELRGGLNFVKRRISSYHIFYVSARILLSYLREDLVFRALVLKK